MSLVLAATAPDIAVFAVAAIMVIAGAVGVIASRNPVHSALNLVLTLVGIAILFLEQDAQFLFAVQVIVYAGAIVILFLFVIMLLGVDRADRIERDRIPAVKPIAVVIMAASTVIVLALAHWRWKATGASSLSGPASGPGTNIGKLADSLFTSYLFAFEATSLLLVIAVVGAVVLSRRPESKNEAEDVVIDLTPREPEPEADATPEEPEGEADEEMEAAK